MSSKWIAYPDCFNCVSSGPCPCFKVISISTSDNNQIKGDNKV